MVRSRKLQHVPGSQRSDIQSFDRMLEIVFGTGRRRHVDDRVHRRIDFYRTDDIVAEELEPSAVQMSDILACTSEEII